MPNSAECHGPIWTTAQLHVSEALEGNLLCDAWFELAQRKRRMRPFPWSWIPSGTPVDNN